MEPGYALRCTIGVAIPLVAATLLGDPALGVAGAIGAFITGFTSLQGVYRTRLTAMLFAALGMAATSFIGSLAGHSSPAIVAATVLAGYACGTIGQLGPAASTVALNSFVAFVLFSSRPLGPEQALIQSACVLGGGLVQAVLLLIAWPAARRGVERAALADVYRNLASYARGIAENPETAPPITPLATARQVLADPQPFARSGEIARVNRLLEDAEVIRKRLGALAAGAPRGLPRTLAESLDAIARVLMGSDEAVPAFAFAPDDDAHRFAAADLASHVRDAAEAATMLARGRVPNVHLLSKPRPGPYVQTHIDWLSRDALRFALVAGIAMILGRHFAAERGYWIALTAALVLKPDFQTTFVRGVGRIGGTLVGAVVAGFAVALVRGHPALQVAGVLTTAAAAYLTFNPNYALFTIAITSFVVMILSMQGVAGTTTIEQRVLDTLAGGALAMIGFLALPSWERKRTRPLLGDLLDAQRRLADAILAAYANPSPSARKTIAAARTAIWKVRTAVETSIDRTRHEPTSHHTIGAARALRILAATQRFALANLVLETALETQRLPAPPAALTAFAAALDDEMAELARALRASRAPRCGPRLREERARLEAELDARDPEQRLVLDAVGGYAEAIARLRRLLGARSSTA
ncbi:MAG TPA: FUSC family protein [Candidatus Binatia bacterium]|nr:FUSC family protein [Candidatus Binatia bacterium]